VRLRGDPARLAARLGAPLQRPLEDTLRWMYEAS
jgi:hypothetical protein